MSIIDNNLFTQTNPNPNSPRNNPSLAGQLTNLNNEMTAIEDSLIQGYVRESATVSYISASSFTVSGNKTDIYTNGRTVRFSDGTTAVVSSSTYSSPNTTVNIVQGTVPSNLSYVDIAIEPQGKNGKEANINPSTITLTEQSSTPSNPPSGKRLIYAKTDGKLYKKNPDGTEEAVGTGETLELTEQSSTPSTPTSNKGVIYLADGTVDSDKQPILLTDTGLKHYLELNNSKYRQAIINGGFDIWQRGTSFTSSGYTADRWYYSLGTGGAATVSQQSFTLGQTNVPFEPTYYLRANQTTGASSSPYLEQRIESVRTFAGNKISISFYGKVASGTLNITVKAVQNFGTGGSPSSTVETTLGTVQVGTSWAKKTITGTVPSISGKTLGTNNNDYLAIRFEFPTSTTYTFDISSVNVNYGEIALPFYPKSYEEELRACQRYYIKYSGENLYQRFAVGYWYNSITAYVALFFPVVLIKIPQISYSNLSHFVVTNGGANIPLTNLGVDHPTTKIFNFNVSVSSGGTAGYAAALTANGTLSAWLAFDAEL